MTYLTLLTRFHFHHYYGYGGGSLGRTFAHSIAWHIGTRLVWMLPTGLVILGAAVFAVGYIGYRLRRRGL